MSQAVHRRWTEAEFFAWLQHQDRRHELVDGVPRLMTGATQRHNVIASNLHLALGTRLRGKSCRTTMNDTGIRIPAGNVRYPDVVVDCGRLLENERTATEAHLVAEVLSPSTMDFDQTDKLEEYRTVPGLIHIMIIDPDQPRLRLHTRADGRWGSTLFSGLDTEVPIATLGLTLRVAELYEGLAFRPSPQFVTGTLPPPPGVSVT